MATTSIELEWINDDGIKSVPEWIARLDVYKRQYQYSGARALFMGVEINFNMDFLRHFNYRLVGEYVYTCLLYTSRCV